MKPLISSGLPELFDAPPQQAKDRVVLRHSRTIFCRKAAIFEANFPLQGILKQKTCRYLRGCGAMPLLRREKPLLWAVRQGSAARLKAPARRAARADFLSKTT